MSELRDLYQEVILDHYKKPRNFHELKNEAQKAEGHNPLCGDRVTVYVRMKDGRIEDIAFQGSGCAISTASASMMTENLKGKTAEEADQIFHTFHQLVTGQLPVDQPHTPLGKLEAFSGVCEFPLRVKCASLAWHTLKAALEQRQAPITTE